MVVEDPRAAELKARVARGVRQLAALALVDMPQGGLEANVCGVVEAWGAQKCNPAGGGPGGREAARRDQVVVMVAPVAVAQQHGGPAAVNVGVGQPVSERPVRRSEQPGASGAGEAEATVGIGARLYSIGFAGARLGPAAEVARDGPEGALRAVGQEVGDLGRASDHRRLLAPALVGVEQQRRAGHAGDLDNLGLGVLAQGRRLHLRRVQAESRGAGHRQVLGRLGPADPQPGTAPHRVHLCSGQRVGAGARAPRRHELERNAEDLCVLRCEQLLLAGLLAERVVVGSAQRPSGDLLAEQLRRERPEPQDLRDSARVPAFGEHRHRHHATHAGTESALACPRC